MHSGGRCYHCYRPRTACFCAAIPSIDNRTEVLILQHRREQFHRFNTARIVHQALRNSQLVADYTANLAQRLEFKRGTALLYPGPKAALISDLPVDQRPRQLVVVDGTWHHVKTLLRDLPALQSLPRYQLNPSNPSRYRLRREPHANCLSTVEAAVAALQILEPETAGFDQLLRAFEMMVDLQLAHPRSAAGPRFNARRGRTVKNIPLALHGSLEQIVVAYGEAAPGQRGRKKALEPPITWTAQRLGDGATFACTLTPPAPLDEQFLRHLDLTQDDFAEALPLAEARERWAAFQRPGDLVTVVHPGTARLFAQLTGERTSCLLLKAIELPALGDAHANVNPATWAEHSSEFGESTFTTPMLGRSTKRLVEAITLVRQLNALVNRRAPVRRMSPAK